MRYAYTTIKPLPPHTHLFFDLIRFCISIHSTHKLTVRSVADSTLNSRSVPDIDFACLWWCRQSIFNWFGMYHWQFLNNQSIRIFFCKILTIILNLLFPFFFCAGRSPKAWKKSSAQYHRICEYHTMQQQLQNIRWTSQLKRCVRNCRQAVDMWSFEKFRNFSIFLAQY